MKIIKDIKPDITTDRISCLLGYGNNRKLSRRLKKKIEDSIGNSSRYIKPRILYTEKNIKGVDDGKLFLEENIVLNSRKMSKVLGSCKTATVFLATIGKGIDSLTQKLMQEKKVANAYIYDTIGSVAAENIVEKFQKKFDTASQSKEEKTTLRFSPGYCDWKVQEQAKIFQMIDNSLVDVHLSNSCLMTPRKSVSGIFGVGNSDKLSDTVTNPCTLCGMKNRIARRTES